jgi:hypothetical protein
MELILQKENDYESLVWYARKSQEDIKKYDLKEHISKIETKFPAETTSLKSTQTGDWQHGFNSGMLAGLRFVLSVREFGIEDAEEFFPELDT